jgi:hypothetical protein
MAKGKNTPLNQKKTNQRMYATNKETGSVFFSATLDDCQ